MPDFSAFLLGRRPHDPARLAMMPRFRAGAVPVAPAVLDRSGFDFRPQMFANDQLGSCTAAGIGNAILAVSALNGYQRNVPDAAGVEFYSRSTGYVPGDPSTDQGGVLADVLQWQATNGFTTPSEMLVADFANLDATNLNLLRDVAAAAGVCYLGVNLYAGDMNPPDEIWDTDYDKGELMGGHCIAGPWDWKGNKASSLARVITWGGLQPASWRWILDRTVEAHFVAWRTIGGSIPGIEYDRLEADMATFLSSAIA